MKYSPLRVVILKVASRCNLDCSYCYVYNGGDESWRNRPVTMTNATFTDMLGWLECQLLESGQEHITLLFHGGEPLLIGPARFEAWCREAMSVIGQNRLNIAVQTNAVLINQRWAEVFMRHGVTLGVSLDGPPAAHDQFRVDHRGRGSYTRVRTGLQHLEAAGVPWALLAVVNLDRESLSIHRHLVDEVGAKTLDYLIPDLTHESVDAVRRRYGSTPLADWLIPVFDDWWDQDSIRVRVRTFDALVQSVLQGPMGSGQFGNPPLGYLVVESDGTIEGLDVLKICRPGLAETGLNVWSKEPLMEALGPFHRQSIFQGVPLPTACGGCREAVTCAGGWLPHRYSHANGFDNPSAWCADLYKLFEHVRSRVTGVRLPTAAPRARAAGLSLSP